MNYLANLIQRDSFCVSTSYRQEPNAIPGRHDIIFPMFEFEMPGNIHDLARMEYELVKYLGFKEPEERTYGKWQQFFWFKTRPRIRSRT